jgi:F-type H+-transporting ATPase subunit a
MYYLMTESYFAQLISAIKERFSEEIKVGDIGEEMRSAISSKELFSFSIGGMTVSISETIVTTWIVMAVIMLLTLWLGRNFNEVPKRRQTVAEAITELLLNLCKGQNLSQKQAEIVTPFVGSLAIFIALSNTIAVFKLPPPAKDVVFPVTLALFTVGYVIFTGIRLVGLKGFWGSLTFPMPALLPFKLLDYIIKPISLSLRLFGNIFGAFILMEFVYIIVPAILPGVLGLWFDLADGLLQGVVFTYLTVIYIGEIVEGAAHSEEQKHAKQKQVEKKRSDRKIPAGA